MSAGFSPFYSHSRRSLRALLLLLLATPLLAGEATTDKVGGQQIPERPVFVNLVPRERAVLSAEVTSRVTAIHRELGEIFKANTPLVEMDNTVYAANRDRTRAEVATARAQLETVQSLLVDGGSSTAEVEAARLTLATAEANLTIAQREVDACTLRAPYEGRVERVLVNRYETVQPGQKLIEIVNDKVLRAQFLVPASRLSSITKGASITVTVHDVGVTAKGTITHIGAVVDPASTKVKVFAEIPNPDRTIRAGLRGSLLLSSIGKADE